MPDSGELHWAEAGFATMIWELLCVLFLATVLLLLFLRADGDMTLLWAHWQGRRPERELTDMVVWVTGASSGIGEELAFQLSKLGVSLVLSARRVHELERVKRRCLENGNLKEKDILVLPLDLRDRSSHEMATKVVLKEFGRIDILVNNGGIAQNSLTQDANLDVFKELMEVNYLGTVSLTKCVLPHMLERMQGKIVIVNSIVAIRFTPFCSGYCASKNALQGFSNSLRVELIKYPNITISNIFLGPVKSNIFQNCLTEEVSKTSGNCAKQLPKMETSHCVQLMLIAIANDLKEVWISEHSFLLSAYVCQYMPVLSWWIFKKAQKKTVEKRLLARQPSYLSYNKILENIKHILSLYTPVDFQ